MLSCLYHAVEAGIPAHAHIIDAYTFQQGHAVIILYKYMLEAGQHLSLQTTVPLEETMIFPEDSRNKQCGYTALSYLR